MNSHSSSHIKFGEVGDIFTWPLLMEAIPLKCWLKWVETCKTIFVLTEYDPDIGFLTSEGYPYSYPRNTDNISPAYSIPEGLSINIYFQDFDVEESAHCQ